ncbi:MAG: helix-turn-helix domain-containing protein [Oscillospiraceae bacterium]|nr:helix-turn-helix domain-containing protein [Oscillospiraceae bacterium]
MMLVFAERLKTLRKSKGVLQKDIAELLSISDRHCRLYEAGGVVDPPISKMMILADYFDVSLDYLVGRSDDPKRR